MEVILNLNIEYPCFKLTKNYGNEKMIEQFGNKTFAFHHTYLNNKLVIEFDSCLIKTILHQGTIIQERLLNKPYVNEVTLRGQNPPLKCC